jgi:hypothetical protein
MKHNEQSIKKLATSIIRANYSPTRWEIEDLAAWIALPKEDPTREEMLTSDIYEEKNST